MLCVPGLIDAATIAIIQRRARERRAFLILDCAETDTVATVIGGLAGKTGVDAPNSALYFPWVEASDPLERLNPRAVDCIRSFASFGTVLFGTRTLDGDDTGSSDWQFIPVRRLAPFMEESISRGTQWAVFEPNGASLWAQLRLSVGAFMQSLFVQGAFAGATPETGYSVRCDATTTTPADIDRGVVDIVVGFAPLRPAEFVILTIQQLAGGGA